jgi:transcription-repair coupling factor (superfamily II helicase)
MTDVAAPPKDAEAPALRDLLDFARRDRSLQREIEAAALGGRARTIAGLAPPAAAVLAAALPGRAPGGKVILIVPGEKEAEGFRADLRFAAGVLRGRACRVLLFPPLEADPYQGLAPHLGVACERVQALRALRAAGEAIVVAPMRALIHPLAPPAAFDAHRMDLRRALALRPDDLSGFLLEAGYTRVDLVTETGEFSRRGGIIDFFPPGAGRPVRVEFWGEEVESLRHFDPEGQRSGDRLEAAVIEPVREYPWTRGALERLTRFFEERRAARRPAAPGGLVGRDDLGERLESLRSGRLFDGFEACARLVEERPAGLLEYAPEALVATWEEGQVLSDLEGVFLEMHASFDLSEEFGLPAPEELLLPRDRLEPAVRSARLRLSELALEDGRPSPPVRVACAPPRSYRGRLHELAADLKAAVPGTTTLLLLDSPGRLERLAEVLAEYDLFPGVLASPETPGSAGTAGVPATPAGGGSAAARPDRPGAAVPAAGGAAPSPGLLIGPGRLSEGFTLTAGGLQVLTEREVFGERAERETRRRRVAAFSPGFRDLKTGDLVVHVEQGIGRYSGITRVGEGEAARDFMVLLYEGGDRLYVPIDRLDLVQRYSGIAGQRPKLDRLGGPGWERTQKKVRKAVQEMAHDLLGLYAARKAARGHAFSPDTPWQKEFEEAFPYAETPDQMRAILETKKDMESGMPMDRLICGDVGFGKTEVAMRAAFKAVMDARQAAVLCPTTVLAFQHLTTFRARFSSWPVTIEMISRFRTPREQKAILKAVTEGKIDILIGTHRLLSKDVKFRDLGLLVVDEEQRFGVAHKEAIKALKRDVDVLTLTATPIPRTLQMSLAGIRDMSVIATPPENRLAIQTAIVPFREGVIAAAARHELKRGGQIYLVHNRVESIGAMAKLIGRVVPEARVGVAHGQMSEAILERTMLAFVQGEFDLLLTTTIIENGLDIPRVNTIIVNRADRFGLAQLYQLRGRVGRSDRHAYAYLLVPAKTPLTPVARRRLKALQEFTELGSGFRIAAMDLEIRGAGNLLGAEQSGHIAAVGFEMYCRLLERTVRELKGETPEPERRSQINLGVDIKIPEETIPDFSDRLVLYKRISSAGDEEELRRIRAEIGDLYGAVPRQADNLLALASLRLHAERLRVRSIEYGAGRVQVRFAEDAPVGGERLVGLASSRPGLALSPGGVLRIEMRSAAGGAEAQRIEAVRGVLQALLPCDSIPVSSQPSAVGPSNGER